jgi:DNA-directed RNA polymerase subunit beta
MANVIQSNFRIRKNLGRVERVIEVPNLIDIQKSSYDKFLQTDVPPGTREDVGLQAVFRSVFPIKDFNGMSELVFVSYSLEKPKYDVDECRARGMTFGAPIKVTTQLMIYENTGSGNEKIVRDIKEQEVYFGEIPLMTETGTFIINGAERVIVSQLHRSPGVFFDDDKGKTHSSGKVLYSARIIPYRGSWLDFEFDPKDLLYVRIDRRRKLLATVLLRALGYDTQSLLNYFYTTETIVFDVDGNIFKRLDYDQLAGQRATRDVKAGDTVVVKKGAKFTKLSIKKLRELKVEQIPLDVSELKEKITAGDVFDEETGEVMVPVNEVLTEDKLDRIRKAGIREFKILFIDGLNVGPYLRDTIVAEKGSIGSADEAIMDIYKKLRPGEPPTKERANDHFNNLFFNPERYDLSKVGRLKLNYKFYAQAAEDQRPSIDQQVLTPQDIMETVRHLIELKNGRGSRDDIDHLGNRRVRAVGELMENQFRVGLQRMERAIKERMTLSQELDTLMPHDLINSKPVSAVIREYFGSSQLSQFMDQTNPLSEVTHKRRLSALGPGGLTRERASFEVRDVHPTHYGRICPIETPEGPNIGLIASLASYARVNEYGFVETPYRLVFDGRVTDKVVWFSALEEENKYIAQASAPRDKDGKYTEGLVSARKNGEFQMVPPENIALMDVAPNQMVSVAAALVPFLEHDDANRALMGANMQRQAVPLLVSDAPLVGTGIEARLAQDSGVCILARHDGLIDSVDANRIVVRVDGRDDTLPDIYVLNKFQRSNQSTCFTQKPIVRPGERVKKGDVLADGPSCDMGELALGRNVLVAFMPWQGYNFEDSILISERIAKDDVFTSIHIEEYECVARDTKLGKEEVTRDIPNVGEEALKDLDESGIVRIGAEVKSGDILVGKITPKGETQLTPEEKLLRAIFGEKAGDVRDTSLRVPPGVGGIVINARVFSRKGQDKDERALQIENAERIRLERMRDEEADILRSAVKGQVQKVVVGKTATGKLVDDAGNQRLKKGDVITEEFFEALPWKYWRALPVDGIESVAQRLDGLEATLHTRLQYFVDKIDRMTKGDELPPGVIKMVKVYIAIKRKLQVGDKMAGRHGNKGVVSRILPEEDLPYLADGRPVDIVLNPLGVPSRMNVGQILETHLGWGARELGNQIQDMLDKNFSAKALREKLQPILGDEAKLKSWLDALEDDDLLRLARKLTGGLHFASPVFDGAPEEAIKKVLDQVKLPNSGQTVLFDGRTGDPFEQDVTVGIMYMLKLHHLVDDKIHARSIGPYSLVTQQPLGGKAQFGGQRLGEMEVWAMEAYGAAYSLQEFLTVKSDDVMGRTRMYESIVKGDCALEPGLPESFNVLIKELQALCLNFELIEPKDTRGAAAEE